MKFNYLALDTDIRKRQFNEKKFQIEVCNEIGISRYTLFRIGEGLPITIEVFIKCVEWLGTDINRYFKTNK